MRRDYKDGRYGSQEHGISESVHGAYMVEDVETSMDMLQLFQMQKMMKLVMEAF